MNIFAKIAIYLILITFAVYFGKHFLRDYQTVTSKKAKIQMLDDPVTTNIDTPAENTASVPQNAENQKSNAETQNPEPNATESEPATITTESAAGNTSSKTPLPPAPRLGFYGGGLCLLILCIGLLAAWDISQFLGNRTVKTLFNEDNQDMLDDEYEAAETEWGKGNYLEAVRLLRDYLAKRPRQQHARPSNRRDLRKRSEQPSRRRLGIRRNPPKETAQRTLGMGRHSPSQPLFRPPRKTRTSH